MYGYIYIITNLINNKKYIGRHKSEIFDESYQGSEKRSQAGKARNSGKKKVTNGIETHYSTIEDL